MKKLILIISVLSCFKNVRNMEIKNKDINEELLIAIITNNKEEVKGLIKKGADLKFLYDGKSLIGIALSLKEPRLDIIKILIKEGVYPTKEEIIKIYNLALEGFDFDSRKIIDLMYEKNYKINEGMIEDNKYFLLSCYKPNVEFVKKFIKEKNANIKEIKDDYENNGLIIACIGGNKEILKSLINMCIDVDEHGEYGFTPLMIAGENGHKEIVELLIKNGANVNDRDNYGWTALTLASHHGHFEIAKLLIEAGTNVNDINANNGLTALSLYLVEKHEDIIVLLIQKNAIITIDKDGERIFNLLIKSHNQNILLEGIFNRDNLINIKLLAFIYMKVLNLFKECELIKNITKKINIAELFLIDEITWAQNSLLIKSFLNFVELCKLSRIKQVQNIKLLMIETLIRYYEGRENKLLGNEMLFEESYKSIKNKINISVSELHNTVGGFKKEFTFKELREKLK